MNKLQYWIELNHVKLIYKKITILVTVGIWKNVYKQWHIKQSKLMKLINFQRRWNLIPFGIHAEDATMF